MCKRFLLLLLAGLFCFLPNAYAWNGSVADSYNAGTGSLSDPYQIATAEQLAKLAAQVNAGESMQGKYFQLTADIVLNTSVLNANGTVNSGTFQTWSSIGNYNDNKAFQGVFDGNAYTISGLYASNADAAYLSLFGYVNGAVVKNVGVTDSYFYGNSNSAGVVAKAHDAKILNCYSSAWIGGKGSYQSGIVSWITGETLVANCYNTGIVNGKNNCSGIVSRVGDASSNNCIVENSFNMGSITTTKTYKAGIVAENNLGGVVRNCFYINTIEEGVYLGSGTKENVIAKTADEMKGADVLSALNNASVFIIGACRWKSGTVHPALDHSTYTSDEKLPEKIEISNPIPANNTKIEDAGLDSLVLRWQTSDVNRLVAHYLFIGSLKDGLGTDTAKCYAKMNPQDTFCLVKGLLVADDWYWRVDECDTAGVITSGTEWHFRVIRPDSADIGFVRPLVNGLIGWATYNDPDETLTGITGGGNGTIVRVETRSELEQYAKATQPYTILITESITGGGTIEVASNKTLIGIGRHILFDNVGINVSGRENIIIRNITIKKGTPDAIAFRNSRHVWVDHCDLSNSNDGLLDFTIGSNYLTVSYTKLHNHDKVSICNSGTGHFEDVNKNKVTYHHNWFDKNVQRNPRIGYGLGHVFNNYYTNISSYCVGYFNGAKVVVENNYFYQSNNPLNQMYSSDPTTASYGMAEQRGNLFDGTSGNTKGTGTVYDPEYYYHYDFMLDEAKTVPSMAAALCGPISGVENEYYPLPGNGVIDVHTQTLSWTTIEDVQSWNVYFGTDTASMTESNVTSRSYTPGELLPETDYFWRVDAICSDTVYEGGLWRFRTASSKASKPYPLDGEQRAELWEATSETACTPLKLTWRPALNATKYRVYLDTVPDLTDESYLAEVSTPKYALPALKYGKTYYWRVSAVAADGSVTEGDIWHFTSDICYSEEGNTEVENMIRNGRAWLEAQDGSWFSASGNKVVAGEGGPAAMSSVWNGPNATCTVTIKYFDESDGDAGYGFYVNETKIQEWKASANNDKMVSHAISGVKINHGDELRVTFYTNVGENCRTDVMNIKIETLGIRQPSENLYQPNQLLTISVYALSGKKITDHTVQADENGHLEPINLRNQGLAQGAYLYMVSFQGKVLGKAELCIIQ